jgi:hypothetical protein
LDWEDERWDSVGVEIEVRGNGAVPRRKKKWSQKQRG